MRWSSTLLAASTTGFLAALRIRTAFSSTSVMPTVASTTKSTASATWIATSACAAMRSAIPRASGSQPPVSTTVNARPFQIASYDTRSRVTPGTFSTTASRRPMMRLTKVDLPTLGRPITARTGTASAIRRSCRKRTREIALQRVAGPGDMGTQVITDLVTCVLQHLTIPRPGLHRELDRLAVDDVEPCPLGRSRVGSLARKTRTEDRDGHDWSTSDQCQPGDAALEPGEVSCAACGLGVDRDDLARVERPDRVPQRSGIRTLASDLDLAHEPQQRSGPADELLLLDQGVGGPRRHREQQWSVEPTDVVAREYHRPGLWNPGGTTEVNLPAAGEISPRETPRKAHPALGESLRCRAHRDSSTIPTMVSTTSSRVRNVLSTTIAPSALANGDAVRVESISSRRARSSCVAAASSLPNSAALRAARSAESATR